MKFLDSWGLEIMLPKNLERCLCLHLLTRDLIPLSEISLPLYPATRDLTEIHQAVPSLRAIILNILRVTVLKTR